MKNIATITTLTLVAAAAMADAAPAAAPASAWSQSANLAITSNYIWRGESQNANTLAIQGGFDVAHTSGLSAGVWASSAGDGWNSKYSVELDAYFNYGFKVSNVDLSVGYLAYIYQLNSSANFTELNVSATYAGVTAKVSKEVANGNASSAKGFTNYGYYYELGYTYSIPAVKGLDLGLHYGIADKKGSGKVNTEDYSVSLTYPVATFAASLAYSNTPGAAKLFSDADVSSRINGGLYSLTLKKTF